MKKIILALLVVLGLGRYAFAQFQTSPIKEFFNPIVVNSITFTTVVGSGNGLVITYDGSNATFDVSSGGIFFSTNGNTTTGGVKLASGSGVTLASNDSLMFSSSTDANASPDTILIRDSAANTLALVNGTNNQELRIYGTTTGPSYLDLTSSSGLATVKVVGSNSQLAIYGGGAGIQMGGTLINQWQLTVAGNWVDEGAHTITSGSTISALRFLSGTAAPGISTCGTGSIDSNSTDAGGKVTATGATACTVTFVAPYPTAAWCVISDDTTIGNGKITAQSASAFTVSALTSGDTFQYICNGK